jgi:hypothetical protein
MKSTGRGGKHSRPCLLLGLALLFAACPGPDPAVPEQPLGPDSLAMGAAGRFGFYSLPDEPERDRYVIDWSAGGLDTTDDFRAGDTLWLDYSWPDTGRVGVRCLALPEDAEPTGWSETHWVTVFNRAPAVPVLLAPDSTRVGTPTLCGAVGQDPEGDRVVYDFAWGDGTQTTTARYASGDTCRQYHAWADTGSFAVRVRSRDDYGNWSDYSPPRSLRAFP